MIHEAPFHGVKHSAHCTKILNYFVIYIAILSSYIALIPIQGDTSVITLCLLKMVTLGKMPMLI